MKSPLCIKCGRPVSLGEAVEVETHAAPHYVREVRYYHAVCPAPLEEARP